MEHVNNKRIAKNTIFLYMRMLVSMFVTLFTSRVILRTLGEEDYGIYNVVGGVVVLLSFLNSTMTISTQRFFSFALGKNSKKLLSKYFSTSINAHLIIAVIATILLETVGLWFLNTKLNIPEDRTNAALWIYQISILTFLVGFLRNPYNAMIVSHERMSAYAYIGILDVVLKLVVAYLIVFSPMDTLIYYGLLVFLSTVLCQFVCIVYCRRNFESCKYSFTKDHALLKEMMSFSGFSMIGSSAVIGAKQGGNILLNIYSGVVANAAFGIASQVSTAINAFVSNFQTAFSPQIVKLYTQQNNQELYKLVTRASVFSYYLLLIITLPFAINVDYVLSLWLTDVPMYTNVFCLWMLVYYIIDATQSPFWMYIYAGGNIRYYTYWNSILHLLNIPISLLLLMNGFDPYWVLAVRAILNFVGVIIRMIHVRILGFPVKNYLKDVLCKIVPVSLFSVLVVLTYNHYITVDNFISFILSVVIAIVVTGCFELFLGMDKGERAFIKKIIFRR